MGIPDDIHLSKRPKDKLPSEKAAGIMERLGRMPPQPHKDVPKKRAASKAEQSPRPSKGRASSSS